MLWLSLQLLLFWNGVYDDFQNQGLIFKNCKFSNCIKISLPQKVKLSFTEFLVSYIKQSHVNWNLAKKILRDSFIPKIVILPFLSQKFTLDWQVNSICCNSSPYDQAKEFNDFQFYYFPFKPEKKNTNKNLCVFKSFQYISHRGTRDWIFVLWCSFRALKPACSSAMISSACGWSLFRMTFKMTLLG